MFTPRLAVLWRGTDGRRYRLPFRPPRYAASRLYDTDPQRLAEVPAVASAILCELEASGQQDPADRDAVLARLTPTPTLNALADAALLIEAIPERLALKHAPVRRAGNADRRRGDYRQQHQRPAAGSAGAGACTPRAATDRSFLASAAPDPAGGGGAGSARCPHLAREVSDFCAARALEAVVLNRAAPGFVGNRPCSSPCCVKRCISSTAASLPGGVDQVMRASLGRRYAMVGPLEAADMTGLATVQDICQHLLPEPGQRHRR